METQNLTSWLDRAAMAFTQRWLHTRPPLLATAIPKLLSTLPAYRHHAARRTHGLWMRQSHGPRGSIAWRTCNSGSPSPASRGHRRRALVPMFPINKNLWTSSYVLLSAGWAALALALLSSSSTAVPNVAAWLRFSTWPWFVFGSTHRAFTVSVILVKLAVLQANRADGTSAASGPCTTSTSRRHLHQLDLARLRHQHRRNLLPPQLVLWRRKIFLKI